MICNIFIRLLFYLNFLASYSRENQITIRNLSFTLNNQAQVMKKKEGVMAADLSMIREKIRQARNQASKVSLVLFPARISTHPY